MTNFSLKKLDDIELGKQYRFEDSGFGSNLAGYNGVVTARALLPDYSFRGDAVAVHDEKVTFIAWVWELHDVKA